MPHWLDQIRTFSEFKRFLILFATVTVFVGGAAFGASKWYVSNQLKKNKKEARVFEAIDSLNQKVDYVLVETGFIAEDQAKMKDTLEEIVSGQEKNKQSINYLGWLMKNQETFTPHQLKILMDEWLKKNGGPTAFDPTTDWSSFVNITGTENQIQLQSHLTR